MWGRYGNLLNLLQILILNKTGVNEMSTYKYNIVRKYDEVNKFLSIFDGNTGFSIRTGILKDSDKLDLKSRDTGVDPFMTNYPELIDVGIMGKCICADKCCVDCYQKAQLNGTNMSLENFKSIIDESKEKTFQVALGGKGDPDTHENFEEILEYSAINNIVPNFTTSGLAMTKEKAELCAKYCGAVAVSEHFEDYTDKAINILLDAGVRVNVHYVLSSKTIDKAIKILKSECEYHKGINAIVFLLYKPVGYGKLDNILRIDNPKIKEFFEAFDNRSLDFKVGFDSCTCPAIVNYSEKYSSSSVEYCEGARFSMYIGPDMMAMPCSFANQDNSWHYRLDNTHTIQDAWNSEIFEKFRNRIRNACKGCPKKDVCGGGCPIIDSICLCADKHKGV